MVDSSSDQPQNPNFLSDIDDTRVSHVPQTEPDSCPGNTERDGSEFQHVTNRSVVTGLRWLLENQLENSGSPADDILQSSASNQIPAPPQVAPLEAEDLQLLTFSLRVSE